jgi:NAD(P)-dependent dehydrogenase (short-subunit alcohol dehydrogenase family)
MVVMSDKAVALVTGVSSGIGRASALELARHGFRVFGTVRGAAPDLPQEIEPVVMDVRDDGSVARAVSEIVSRAGRIDALVNNAGSSIVGAVEETGTEQAQGLFDVNFFGAVRVTRAVLPTMRQQRRGRIIFVSSVAGFLPAPFMGFYAASKHALEGYSESLDHEVRTLGIRSLLVEPTYMKTRIGQNSSRAAASIGDYAKVRERAEAGIAAAVDAGEDPALVAQAVHRAITTPRPRLRYPVGKRSGTLAKLRDWLPESIFDRSLRKEMHLDG